MLVGDKGWMDCHAGWEDAWDKERSPVSSRVATRITITYALVNNIYATKRSRPITC